MTKINLLNCAPCVPLRLRILPIIYTRLTRLFHIYYAPCALLLSSFFLFCVVLFQLRGKMPLFCVCAPINHSYPVSFRIYVLPYKAFLYVFFCFFYFKPLVTPLFRQLFYSNIFIFSVLFFNKHPIFTHLTHG